MTKFNFMTRAVISCLVNRTGPELPEQFNLYLYIECVRLNNVASAGSSALVLQLA
jgi:hypothetical protein